MVINKKNTPGRPKKLFISQKPKVAIKSGPGRPKKSGNLHKSTEKISPEIVGFVAKSVDASKRKDLVIFLLFILSFLLFLVSMYFTFLRDKKVNELSQGEIAEIANIETGNIDYTSPVLSGEVVQVPTQVDTAPTDIQSLSPQQQTIVDFYTAVNTVDIAKLYTMADTPLTQSNVFKTYYSKNWLSKFSQTIASPKIVVTNIQEIPTTSTNPDVKKYSYTVEYVVATTNQKFTEERSTLLIKKNDSWKIGKLMCEIKGCSTMPFFNPDKYK